MAVGGYQYKDGACYYGGWNEMGQRHGFGHLILTDGARYDGHFRGGSFSGLGVLQFPNGTR